MSGQRKICGFTWEVCLYCVSLLCVPTWSYDPCPITARETPGVKVPGIPEYDVEWAFNWGDWSLEWQNKTHSETSVYPGGSKTAETSHPQANPKPPIYQMEAKQRIFEKASKYLASNYDLTPTRVTCGLPQIQPIGERGERALKECVSQEEIVCDPAAKYRTADGSCNNLENPTWGSSFSYFNRLVVPSITGPDGLRKSATCDELPNPRYLSTYVHYSTGKRTSKANNLYVFFGQFWSHDVTFTAQSTTDKNEAIRCCPPSPDNHPQCAPIDASFYGYVGNMSCINFVRSAMYPTCMLGHRTQINTATTFIDGSQIYGNNLDEMNKLRAKDGTGKLLVQNSPFGPLLPPSTDPKDRCNIPQEVRKCFVAGDSRVNQNPMLTSFHTLFVREHNRLATRLKEMNPHWDGEKIFQEARRIVIAQLQWIIATEYYRITLGEEYMRNIEFLWNGPTSYLKDWDPHIFTEFSTAAFRFGHSMIDSTLPEYPGKAGHRGHQLKDSFFEPYGLYEGELDLLMRGAIRTPAHALDRSLVTDVTNYLYRRRGQTAGLDLAALNIQRGRDHALPSYVDVLNLCSPDQLIESFFELEEHHVMTTETIQVLRNVYQDVRNIDLWTGIISEINVHDGLLGPTGLCIFEAQFYSFIAGDRFWLSHPDQPGSFTPSQLSTLKSTSLAAIICGNTNITEIPWRAMEVPSKSNSLQSCSSFHRIDPWEWKEW